MKKILLTSAGLTENMKKIFFKQIEKPAKNIKIIFVPSAAVVNDNAREGIVISIAALLKMGIDEKNILIYNLNNLISKEYDKTRSDYIDYNSLPFQIRMLSYSEMMMYDAIVFCGGYTEVLLDEINRTGFNVPLSQAVQDGLFYIGISAGSMVAAGNLPNNLGFIKNSIIPHCKVGTPCGDISQNEDIYLSDNQSVWIHGDSSRIIV